MISKFLRHTLIIISFLSILSATQHAHAASTADWTTGYYPPNCVTNIIFYQPTNKWGFPNGASYYYTYDVNGNMVIYTTPIGWTMTGPDVDTGSYTSCQNSPPYAPLASFHAGVNKSTSYAPGEAVIVNVLGYNVFFNVAIGGSASFGAWSMSEANMSGCGGTDTFGVYARVCTGSFPAPTTPGTYTINVMGCSLSIYYCTGNTLTFTVVAPVTPVCGVTHNNCTAGTVGATATYADRWQWWCNGSTLPANAAPNLLCQEMKPTVNLWFSFLNTTRSLFSGMLPTKVFAEK